MYSHIYFQENLNHITSTINTLAQEVTLPSLAAFIDARNLACPMPLLKCKLALRNINDNDVIYLVTGDANACQDLVAFCKKNGHSIDSWQNSNDKTVDNSTTYATIFHFIITKKASIC